MRGGLLARLYGRLGRRYLLICVAQVWLFSLFMCALITLLLTDLYLEMPTEQIWPVLGLALLGTVAGLSVALVHTTKKVTPALQRWAAGERTAANAPAAWEAATRATFSWPAVACAGCALFTIPAELLTLSYGPIPTWQLFVVLVPVVQFGILATSILAYFTGEAFLRPIVAEISDCLPPNFEPPGWTPKLRSRLLPAVLVVDIFASILAGGLVSHAASPAEALVFSLAAGVAINLTFSLVWVMALSGSIIGPIKHLSIAAKAVERGDLRTKVPLFGKDELTDLSRAFNQMVEGLAERRVLHAAIQAYIDPAVADIVASKGAFIPAVEADVTIMFVDIVGFTSWAEGIEPSEVVDRLNEYFGLAVPIVRRHGGHPNKLMGDGLMAVFGIPEPLPDHAQRAYAAALEIVSQMAARYGHGVQSGIGLNSGTVVVGTMGDVSKLDYTIIGDAVNVAARVEAFTRETGDRILLTAATRDLLGPSVQESLESRHATTLKGRTGATELFTPSRFL